MQTERTLRGLISVNTATVCNDFLSNAVEDVTLLVGPTFQKLNSARGLTVKVITHALISQETAFGSDRQSLVLQKIKQLITRILRRVKHQILEKRQERLVWRTRRHAAENLVNKNTVQWHSIPRNHVILNQESTFGEGRNGFTHVEQFRNLVILF